MPESFFLYGNAIGLIEMLIAFSLKNIPMKVIFMLVNLGIKIGFYHKNFNAQMDGVVGTMLLVSIFFCIYYDMVERQNFKIIYESREQARKFQSLLSNDFPSSVLITSSDFKTLLYSNNFFQQRFQTDNSLSTLFKKFTITLNSDAQAQDSLSAKEIDLSDFASQLEKQEESFTLPAIFKDEEGHEYHYEIRIRRITWDFKPAFALVFNDISDKQLVMALKFADEQKDKVIATVSHELRTPINGILGLLEMVKARVTDQVSTMYLDNCKSCSSLLLYLVNSILDLSQLRNNSLTIVKNPFKLDQLLEEIRTLYLFQCNEKKIDFLLENNVQEDYKEIYTDKYRLIEVLINLLGNAIKFTFKGSITLRVSQNPSDSSKLIFSVIDTGVGIKPEDRPKLFKMFGKIAQANKNINSHGVGLGLTIVNELVKSLNDDGIESLEFESVYGKGTAFSFTISVQRPSVGRINSARSHSSQMREYESDRDTVSNKLTEVISKDEHACHFITDCGRLSSNLNIEENLPLAFERLHSEESAVYAKNVLVVDDNPFNILAIRFILEKLQFKVWKACNGEECLEILEGSLKNFEKFDLILMDIQMPILDGIETSKIIDKKKKEGKMYEVPIIALTATKITNREREEYKQNGILDWLEKPLKEEQLTKILKDRNLR